VTRPEGPAPRRHRALGLAAVLAALVLAARLALPYAVARVGERVAGDALGLPVAIGAVDLALLRGRAVARSVRIGGVEAGPGLRLGRLAVELSWRDLAGRRLHLLGVEVEDAALRLAPPAEAGEAREASTPEPETGSEAGSETGWPVTADRIRIAGLDLEVEGSGPGEPSLRLALGDLTVRDVTTAGGEWQVGAVRVRGPKLRLGRSLLGELTQEGTPSAPQPGPAPGAGPPRYRIESLSIEAAGVSLVTARGPVELELELGAEGVSAADEFPISVAVRIGEGTIAAEGRAALDPPRFDGTLRWADLPVPLTLLALQPSWLPNLRSCRSEGELTLAVHLGGGPEAAVRSAGQIRVRNLDIGDPAAQGFALRWQELDAELRELLVPLAGDGSPARAVLGSVRLVGPDLQLVRRPAEPAPVGAAGEPAAAPPALAPGAAEAASPFAVEVDRLTLEAGRLAFRDATLASPFEAALRDVSASARNLRWPAPGAERIRMRGVASERAPFRLEGELRGSDGRLDLELQGLPLSLLDPYAGPAGYGSLAGEASLRSAIRLEGERFTADNELRLHQLRLEGADPGAFERQFGSPLDLTLALLRDPSGDIRLDVPVSGPREGLRLELGGSLRTALGAALRGVASAPLKILGAALPGGGANEVSLAPLAARPGRADLAKGESTRVAALARLLRSRPLLAVALTGRAGPEDRAALAEAELVARAARGEPLPEAEGVGFLARRRIAAALRTEAEGGQRALEPEDETALARLVEATEPSPERWRELARARAAALREQLLARRGVTPHQVALAGEALEAAPGVALELRARADEEPGAEPGPEGASP
jgi:Domain of Unknown Function (DUF748)